MISAASVTFVSTRYEMGRDLLQAYCVGALTSSLAKVTSRSR